MRSKQNKLKRRISRVQKAGRPLSDLEKRVEEAISKITHIESALKTKSSQPKIWTVDMVQKSREAEEHLKEVESTLQSVLREIRNPLGKSLPDMPGLYAQRALRAEPMSPLPSFDLPIVYNKRGEIDLSETLANWKNFKPYLYQQLVSDPENRNKLQAMLDLHNPGMKLSDIDKMYD